MHSQPGDGIGRDLSGHRKKSTERGVLTSWRQHREGLVRIRKAIDQAKRTHELETASGGTCQDTEKIRPSKAYPHSGDGRGMDLSGHRNKPTERGALTAWRWQKEGLVRKRKETDRTRRTHELGMAEGGTCQDTESNRPSEAHSLPEDGVRRDLSGHRKKPTERGTLTAWRRRRERLVRTQNECDRARGTHNLESTKRRPGQDT